MKLKNRIMSWLLSPGAYALWHSMGNPEEWVWAGSLCHKKHAWIRFDMPYGGAPPVICDVLVLVLGGFFFDIEDRPSLGTFERHLIAGRGFRLGKRLYKQTSTRRKNNTNLLTALTVNEIIE